MDSIISSNIDVSPNEYITRYSLNRNFLKLVNNDFSINELIHKKTDKILTFNKNKTYSAGDCVFYKVRPDSMNIYLLSSTTNGNSHKPLVMNNSQGDKVVINSDYWKIVGIPVTDNYIEEHPTQSPMSYAIDYVDESRSNFKETHQENTNDDAHPTGKLGINESTKLFRNFSNISSDRETLHYPYHIENLVPDNTIQHGFVRQWDNGLLEYDIVYRLGYQGVDDEGKEILCANTLYVSQRNNNYLYFKDKSDYDIFSQGGSDFVTTKTSRQYNLNKYLNSYAGKINFPIEFRDLNYTIFTSGVKNVETDSETAVDDYIKYHDARLIIQGSNVIGYKPDSSFRYMLQIPYEVRTIGQNALADITETDGYEVKIICYQDGDLNSIERYAFRDSWIRRMTIGRNVRYIAEYAFSNCNRLSTLDFYLENDKIKHPKIEQNAFESTSIQQINIHYRNRMLLGVTEDERDKMYLSDQRLEQKFQDKSYLKLIGITTNPSIRVYYDYTNVNFQNFQPKYVFSDVKMPLGAQMNHIEVGDSLKMTYPCHYNDQYELTDILIWDNDTITGYDQLKVEELSSYIHIDFGDMPTFVTKIGVGALSGFNKLSSINIPGRYTDVYSQAFEFCNGLTEADIDMTGKFIYENCFRLNNINRISFTNILQSRKSSGIVEISGFALSSFQDCSINDMVFEDVQNFSTIQGYFKNTRLGDNIPRVGNSTIIKTITEDVIVRNSGNNTYYEKIPGYLVVKNKAVTSCDFEMIRKSAISRLIVPSPIEKINDGVFCPSLHGIDLSGVHISNIKIANTIKNIGKNAFFNLSSLVYLDIENGSNIEYMGQDMISGCYSLQSLTIE